MKPVMDHFGHACWALHKHVNDFKSCINDDTVKAVNQATLGCEADAETKWIDEAFKKAIFAANKSQLETIVKNWHKNFSDNTGAPGELFLNPSVPVVFDAFRNTKRLKRWLVATFLLELYKSEGNYLPAQAGAGIGLKQPGKFFNICYNEVTYNLVDKDWADVARLVPNKTGFLKKYMKKFASTLIDATGVKKAYSQIFDTNKPKMGWERKVWNGKGGKIIFSDEKNTTYRFDGKKFDTWKHADLGNEGMLKQAIINTK